MTLTLPQPTERELYGRVCAHAFGLPASATPGWFEQAGLDNLRVCEGGAAGLILLPMGQFWGGRSVPMTGIAGVAVAPEHRGAGTATRMMQAAVRELHTAGIALSALYPATVPLYQRAGYERAGARCCLEVDLRDLPTGREGALRRLDGPGDEAMRALYRDYARSRNGYLDRGEYLWGRVFSPFNKGPAEGFAVGSEGYLTLIHHTDAGGELEVEVTDWVATTAASARRLLGLVADYRSLATRVRWHGGAPDLPLLLLPERRHRIEVGQYWMLRIVHLPAALESRGYRGRSGQLELEVEDDLLEANCGRWRLNCVEGRMTVERGGGGGLRLGIRALAMLYSGFVSALTLRAAGALDGSTEALEQADALFADAAPATPDIF